MKIKLSLSTEQPGWQPAVLRKGNVVMLGYWNGMKFTVNRDAADTDWIDTEDLKDAGGSVEYYGNQVAGSIVGNKRRSDEQEIV